MQSTNDPSGTAPPGWYPSPYPGQERWWDGQQWTEAYRPSYQNVQAVMGVGSTPGFGPPPLAPPTHGPAIASMVLGILSLAVCYLGIVTGVIGLVLGITSLPQCAPRGTKRGRGMAITGIVCSSIALAINALLVVGLILSGGQGS